ncbi:MAG: hypothetical protein A2Y64_02585 [Candidatus Coatesbacteria bacterium RBG_13_66_14]|uniref:DUF1318 domain-containing protein n=1 Tax=Candidatus Coatesbacteria bacterium RBG_13_66_14 TaxID=1817816 RepID=A0A1F5F792_9BACT|nr:MAG: hypothetical protein A2Y64_02585 [Candidatus Coatesbacteria bacterium RBG_13_66_14]
MGAFFKILIALPALLLLGSLGCVQAQFNVELVDAKTMLENQVLGSYAELGEDVWMVSNVRATGELIYGYEPLIPEGELDPEKAAALTALLDTLYTADEVTRLKVVGLIGETAGGYLAVTPSGEGDVYAEEIVGRENNNRGLIYDRLAVTTPELAHSPNPRAEVEGIFARYFREKLAPGMYYLDEAGNWLQL